MRNIRLQAGDLEVVAQSDPDGRREAYVLRGEGPPHGPDRVVRRARLRQLRLVKRL